MSAYSPSHLLTLGRISPFCAKHRGNVDVACTCTKRVLLSGQPHDHGDRHKRERANVGTAGINHTIISAVP